MVLTWSCLPGLVLPVHGSRSGSRRPDHDPGWRWLAQTGPCWAWRTLTSHEASFPAWRALAQVEPMVPLAGSGWAWLALVPPELALTLVGMAESWHILLLSVYSPGWPRLRVWLTLALYWLVHDLGWLDWPIPIAPGWHCPAPVGP